jgi:hypothetical protein
MGVSGQCHAPAALYPAGKDPGTHWTGGWVDLWTDAEARGEILCLFHGSNPGRPVCSQTLCWLSYPSCWRKHKFCRKLWKHVPPLLSRERGNIAVIFRTDNLKITALQRLVQGQKTQQTLEIWNTRFAITFPYLYFSVFCQITVILRPRLKSILMQLDKQNEHILLFCCTKSVHISPFLSDGIVVLHTVITWRNGVRVRFRLAAVLVCNERFAHD